MSGYGQGRHSPKLWTAKYLLFKICFCFRGLFSMTSLSKYFIQISARQYQYVDRQKTWHTWRWALSQSIETFGSNVEVDCHFYLQRFPELKTGRTVRRGLIHCTLMWKKTTVSSYMWKIGWVWEIHTIINMSLVKHVIRVGWPKHVMQKNKLRKLGSCFCQRGLRK